MDNIQEELIPEEVVEDAATALPSEIVLPDAMALDNHQYETLVLKLEETKQSIDNNTMVMSILLGLLIGILFVRGLSIFVKGV